jgi:hypothetical protein
MCSWLTLTLSLLMSYIYIYIYMELHVKPEILNLRLETLKTVSFYLLQNVSTLNQCRNISCVTVVCKHFASYQGYHNYKLDLIR